MSLCWQGEAFSRFHRLFSGDACGRLPSAHVHSNSTARLRSWRGGVGGNVRMKCAQRERLGSPNGIGGDACDVGMVWGGRYG
jgi:hypothetical protein